MLYASVPDRHVAYMQVVKALRSKVRDLTLQGLRVIPRFKESNDGQIVKIG